MRTRWWQSIRWRLALGSALLVLVATGLLGLVAVGVIDYYYSADQKPRLIAFADDRAQSIVISYDRNPQAGLQGAVGRVFGVKGGIDADTQQPFVIVFDKGGMPIYPTGPNLRGTRPERNAALAAALKLVNPSIQNGDLLKFRRAIIQALATKPVSSDEDFGRDTLLGYSQPFSVRPLVNNGETIGALVVTARANTVPTFVGTVGGSVFVASLIIAVLAIAVAILFARTITRPLARLTSATRALTAGDYNARVRTGAKGELGELALNFNEMAAQLHKDMEELLRQEAWRHELIINITHDLATPLTAIAGLGESLMDGVNSSYEDYEATGRVIMRETLRLRRLVQDLHVMAKVETGALDPRKKSIRLAALVDETLAALAPEFERHCVEPINAVPYQIPPLLADPDMLTRVFSNLCANALRHTPAGGKVQIEAREQNDWLFISVTDTGEGIPTEALPQVFERFFRADSARQSSTGGSGLGLAIVRAIIEAHGGQVWAENATGAGARISFILPLKTDFVPMPALPDTPTLPLHKRPRQTTT
jgi:signal transduction histidine kinase